MKQMIRVFILLEVASFAAASLIHSGALIAGYEHGQASVAEGMIAAVLFAGLVFTFIRPDWTRPVGLAVQGFALLGTLVGLTTIAIGVGPRTVPDLVYHVTILLVLIWGLIITARTHVDITSQHA